MSQKKYFSIWNVENSYESIWMTAESFGLIWVSKAPRGYLSSSGVPHRIVENHPWNQYFSRYYRYVSSLMEMKLCLRDSHGGGFIYFSGLKALRGTCSPRRWPLMMLKMIPEPKNSYFLKKKHSIMVSDPRFCPHIGGHLFPQWTHSLALLASSLWTNDELIWEFFWHFGCYHCYF